MKRDCWAALVDVYRHGTADDWRQAVAVVREMNGLVLLKSAFQDAKKEGDGDERDGGGGASGGGQ